MIFVQENGILIPGINNTIFCSTYVFNSVINTNKKTGRISQPTPTHVLTTFSDFRSLRVPAYQRQSDLETALIFYKKAFISVCTDCSLLLTPTDTVCHIGIAEHLVYINIGSVGEMSWRKLRVWLQSLRVQTMGKKLRKWFSLERRRLALWHFLLPISALG